MLKASKQSSYENTGFIKTLERSFIKIMIDTVVIKFREELSEIMTDSWYEDHNKPKSGLYTFLYPINNNENIYLEYRKRDYSGKPLLLIQLSVPKCIYGNNIDLVRTEDIEKLQQLYFNLCRVDPRLPTVNLLAGVIHRIDFCCNYYVGKYLDDFIAILRRSSHPTRKRCCYSNKPGRDQDNGVVFPSGQVQTKFYDKELEAGLPFQKGILRHETSYRDEKRIAKLFGQKQPTLASVLPILPGISKKVLEKDLKIFGFNIPVDSITDKVDNTLPTHQKPTYALAAYGLQRLLDDNPDLDDKMLSKKLGCSVRCIREHRKKARIAIASIDKNYSEHLLPPLEVNM